jgi:hypothetical protein
MKKTILVFLQSVGALCILICVLLFLIRAVKAVHSNLLEKHGTMILNRVLAANRCWLAGPPQTIANYRYSFHTLREQANIVVTNPASAPFSKQRGIDFEGLLPFLSTHPMSARIESVNHENGKTELNIDFNSSPFHAWYGNGIPDTRAYYGDFSGPVSSAQLVINDFRNVPLSAVLRGEKGRVTATETYSDYTDVAAGQSVPLTITVRSGSKGDPLEFDWKFNVYQGGLWLFDQSQEQYQSRSEKVAWVDQVFINGQTATPE